MTSFLGGVIELRTVEGEGGVKKPEKSGVVLYGRPPIEMFVKFQISKRPEHFQKIADLLEIPSQFQISVKSKVCLFFIFFFLHRIYEL